MTRLLLALLTLLAAPFALADDPAFDLTFEADRTTVWEGETIILTATLTTSSPEVLPVRADVFLPAGLTALSSTRVTGGVSQRHPRILEVEARADVRGTHDVRATATLEENGTSVPSERRVQVRVQRPATLTTSVAPADASAGVGSATEFLVQVRNGGDVLAEDVKVRASFPALREQAVRDWTLDLGPGEGRDLLVEHVVPPEAPGSLELHVSTEHDGHVEQTRAAIDVQRATLELVQALAPTPSVPGQDVHATVRVHNHGASPLSYTLATTWPEWLAPEGADRIRATLEPGEGRTHEQVARMRFGAPAEGRVTTTLTAPTVRREIHSDIAREPVDVRLAPNAPTLRLPGSTSATLTVRNPSSERLVVNLEPRLPSGLEATPLPAELDLAPGERVELPITLTPTTPGTHRYEATAFHRGGPASLPAGVDVTALAPLQVERRSTLSLPFRVDAEHADALLVRQALPLDATYVPGSSRLADAPLPDPRAREREGRTILYWEAPFGSSGVLRYDVLHRTALADLPEPSFTLLVDGYDVPIRGDLTRDEALDANPVGRGGDGWILEPAADAVLLDTDQTQAIVEAPYPGRATLRVNGEAVDRARLGKASYDEMGGTQRLEYFGLLLQPGRNTLTVQTSEGTQEQYLWVAENPIRLHLEATDLLADGSTPVTLKISARDENDLLNGFGSVSIRTNGTPATPDAFPMEPGHQLLMRDGEAILTLEPYVHPARLEIHATFNDLEAEDVFHVGGVRASLFLAQGSTTAHLTSSGANLAGLARAYLETPLGNGTLQAALDTTGPLARDPNAGERPPLVGVATEARPALTSGDGIAFRYDTPTTTLGYFRDDVHLPGLQETLNLTGLHAQTQLGPDEVNHVIHAIAALAPAERVTQRITPDGTRAYPLQDSAQPDSVEVRIEADDDADVTGRVLVRGHDYVLGPERDTILLASPLWRFDTNFEPITLVVSYAPSASPRTRLVAGAGYEVRHDDGWFAGIGVLHDETLRGRVHAGMKSEGIEAEIAYALGTRDPGVTLNARTRHDPLRTTFRAHYDPETGDLKGDADATLDLSEGTRLNAAHERHEASDTTSILVEHDLEPVTLAGGVQYAWQDRLPEAIARLQWQHEKITAALAHEQPLRRNATATSELQVKYQLLDALRLESGLQYAYGEGLRGSIGLTQEIADSTLTLAYQVPGASTTGNRLRFGVKTPLPVNEHWSIDLNAGHEHALANGSRTTAASAAARYRTDDLVATLGIEASISEEDAKLTLRAGTTGALAPETTFSVTGALRILPTVTGEFVVAHAYRGGKLATHGRHRLELGERDVLEGEVHPTLFWEGRGQVRSTLAYRIPIDHLYRGLLQASLGGTVHVLPGLGLGGGVHHLEQPGLHASKTAWGIEGSARLAPDVWFSAGYTLNGFEGLTLDTDGFYIRLDAVGGTHE